VKDVASFLHQLLPPEVRVPAALRYTIARGLGMVEAPPFASLAAFSAALRRFEACERGTIVRALLARASRIAPAVVPAESLEKPLEAAVLRPLVIPPVPSAVVAALDADAEPAAQVPLAPPTRVPPAAVERGRAGRWRAAAVAASLVVSALGGYTVASWRQRAATTSASSQTAVSAPASASVAVPTATAGHVEARSGPPVAAAPRASTTPALSSTASVQTRTARRQATSVSPRAVRREPPARRDSKAPLQPYRALPREELPALSPSFAANGSAMFFQTGGPGAAQSAIAMASGAGWPGADLHIVKVVDDGARNYHAQPSPDGRFIAFDSDRDGVRAVYVADRDGSHVRRVSGPGYAAVPTWSPDGTRLAYIRAEADKPSVWNLWVQPISGGPARRVTSFRMGQTWGGSWFPDNRRIAYSHEDSLSIVDLVSGETRELASPVRGRLVRTPAVSPDGTRVVFQVYRSGAWMIDLRDGSMQCVLADPTAEEFAWAPDGRRIAFHSKRDGQWGIYLMPRG
jgi:Tol biopolymer transport system component